MRRFTSTVVLCVAALAAIATSRAETGTGVRASGFADGPAATLTSEPTTWRIAFAVTLPGDFVPTDVETSVYVDIDASQVDTSGAVETTFGACDGSDELFSQTITGGEQFGVSTAGVFDQCGVGTTCNVELCLTAAASGIEDAPIVWSVDAIAEYVEDPEGDAAWEDGTIEITIDEI